MRFCGAYRWYHERKCDLVEDTDLWAAILAPSLVAPDLIPWAVEILERPEDWGGDIKSRFATSPSPLMLMAESVPSVVEIRIGGIWGEDLGASLLSRPCSLVDSSPLVGVEPFSSARQRRLNSFEEERQLKSLQNHGFGGTSKNCLSRSIVRAAAAL